MSKSWTTKELAKASEFMVSQGNMSYNEFTQALAKQTGVPPMDGFTPNGMFWYMEKAGQSFDLFIQTNADSDSYRLVYTGSYEECMVCVSKE